jgi:hypothetical protein
MASLEIPEDLDLTNLTDKREFNSTLKLIATLKLSLYQIHKI